MKILLKLYQATGLSTLVSTLTERMLGWSSDIKSLVYKEYDGTTDGPGTTRIIPSIVGNGTNTIANIPSHSYLKYNVVKLGDDGIFTSAISTLSANNDATHFIFDTDVDNIYVAKNGIWTVAGLNQGDVYLSSLSANALTNDYTGIEQFIGIYDGTNLHLDFDNNVYRRPLITSGYVYFDGVKYNSIVLNELDTSGGYMTSGATIYFDNTYLNTSGLYLYSSATSAYSNITADEIDMIGSIYTSANISGVNISGVCFYEDGLELSAKYLTSGDFDSIFATIDDLNNYLEISATSSFATISAISGLASIDELINYFPISGGTISGDIGFYGVSASSQPIVSGSINDINTLNNFITSLSNIGLINNQVTSSTFYINNISSVILTKDSNKYQTFSTSAIIELPETIACLEFVFTTMGVNITIHSSNTNIYYLGFLIDTVNIDATKNITRAISDGTYWYVS